MRRIDKQNITVIIVHKTNMRTCIQWPLAEHFPPLLDKKPKLSTKLEEPNKINFIRMLTFHRLQNSPRQKNYPLQKARQKATKMWPHIMHIMHIIAFGKHWRYCMKLIITSQETQMDRYPEKNIVYAAHQKATKCGPRP